MSETLSGSAGAFLDAWLSHDWAGGLQTEHLPECETFIVETENSRYELRILCGRSGDVVVRGGRFFSEETTARLIGSSLGGGLLKLRGIYIGFRMELCALERPIMTSPVRSIGWVSRLDGALIPLFF